MLNRRGTTLVELIVAITLAAAVLGTASASVLRQQRTHSRIRAEGSADAQLRGSTMALAAQLALLQPDAGDIDPTQAQDSALQFRAPVAVSFACASEAGAATLIPEPPSSVTLGGSVASVHAGDSLWWRADSGWAVAPVTATAPIQAACTTPLVLAGPTVRLLAATLDTIPAGAPLRVTRQTRYAIYRAGDGTWQLGFREWSASTQGFAAPQPVAGPLVPRAATRRSGFRYFDDTGAELTPSATPLDVSRLALIRVTMQTLATHRDASRDSVRADSIDIAVRRALAP